MSDESREGAPSWRRRSDAWQAFALVAVAGLIYSLIHGRVDSFPYDANYYFFRLGNQPGAWTIDRLADPVRGYSPLVLFGALRAACDAVGADPRDVVPPLNALLFAWITTILLPRFAADTWPELRWGVLRRVALGATFIAFWGGYLGYPLTDFPALAAALVAISLARRANSPAGWLATGFAASVAVNLRPAYLVLALGVVALAFLTARRAPTDDSRRRVPAAMLLVVIGAAVVALPQLWLSGTRHGAWSPVPGAASELGTLQLTAGLRLQLYGTVLDPAAPDAAGLNYRDFAGEGLVRSSDLARAEVEPLRGQLLVRDTATYAGIALRDPIGYGALLVRHVVNGADQRFASPYPAVPDHGQRRPFRVAGFVVIWLALLRLGWPAARRALGPARWGGPIVLLAGIVTTIPSAVEQRFMLPLFAVAVLLACAPGWRRLADELPSSPSRRARTIGFVAASLVVYVVVVGRIVEGTSSSLERTSVMVTKNPWR